MTAEEAMAEIWAITCADCGPEDYKFMVSEVLAMKRMLPAWLKKDADLSPTIDEWESEVDDLR